MFFSFLGPMIPCCPLIHGIYPPPSVGESAPPPSPPKAVHALLNKNVQDCVLAHFAPGKSRSGCFQDSENPVSPPKKKTLQFSWSYEPGCLNGGGGSGVGGVEPLNMSERGIICSRVCFFLSPFTFVLFLFPFCFSPM